MFIHFSSFAPKKDKMIRNYCLLIFLSTIFTHTLNAQKDQSYTTAPVKIDLNQQGTRYVRFTGLGQIWLRNTQMNPGTTINGYETEDYNDISIRRLRFSIYGQLTDKLFFYTQFGQNNFNFHSPKYEGAFFHDAILEYALAKKHLVLGGGLTGWSGLTRYASPSIGSNLALDAPLYQQTTNGINDQFIRKLTVYAKGQLDRLDYRLALTSPMTITNPQDPMRERFVFSNEPPKMQTQAYLKWMFLDKEGNTTPYHKGSYLGNQSVLNLGAGVIYQPDAMWAINAGDETIFHEMMLLGIDLFYDRPISKHSAITTYLAYTNYDFGPGYFRNVGVNNAGTGSLTDEVVGFGGAYPMVGTGSTFYGQIGYLFGNSLLSEYGKLQPFITAQISDYDVSDENMNVFELGFNYLINGTHGSKISFVYQNRPVYERVNDETNIFTRKAMSVIQYQLSF